MANKKYEETDIQAIAEAIREKTGSEDSYKVSEMANGVNEVYEAGKQAQYDAFWDSYQDYGNRTNYNGAFCSQGFKEANFRPKYNINVTEGERMFYQFNSQGKIFDLVEHLNNLGITMDFSNNIRAYYMFREAKISRIGTFDMTNLIHNSSSCFNNSTIAVIDKLIFSEKTDLTNLFNGAYALATIKDVEGVIPNSISFSISPLTVESMKSVITHLKDDSGTDSEYTYTVTFKATAFEALEAEGNTSPNGNTWTEYIDDLKWNLTLA